MSISTCSSQPKPGLRWLVLLEGSGEMRQKGRRRTGILSGTFRARTLCCRRACACVSGPKNRDPSRARGIRCLVGGKLGLVGYCLVSSVLLLEGGAYWEGWISARSSPTTSAVKLLLYPSAPPLFASCRCLLCHINSPNACPSSQIQYPWPAIVVRRERRRMQRPSSGHLKKLVINVHAIHFRLSPLASPFSSKF